MLDNKTGHHTGLTGRRGVGIGAGLGGGRRAQQYVGHHAGLIERRGAGIDAGLGGGDVLGNTLGIMLG